MGREKEKAMREDRLALTHVGEHQSDYLNAVTPPVFLNSLHIFEDMDGYLNNGKTGAYVYGRVANPTVHILEEKVAVIPGSAFGPGGEGFVRACYAASMKDIAEAVARMDNFLTNLRRKQGSEG